MKLEKRIDEHFNIKKLNELSAEFNLSESIMKLLFLREIDEKEKITNYLTPNLNNIHNPYLLTNMKEVVEKIQNAIIKKHRIVIFGDYDVDGMSASSILYLYLKNLGVSVEVFLPNRYIDEYGLTKGAIDKVVSEYNPNLIITVDCGITAVEEVEYVKSLGIEIIITDHHEVPQIKPNCLIINPKMEGQAYPFKELCGSGVSLKVVQALGGLESLEEYLDIAALATIADIVDLTDENRIIVQLGLEKLKTKTREGLKLLFKELKLNEDELNSIDIAFKVAPKINATGRMGDAMVGFYLFIEKDKKKLSQIIKKIIELNTLRQDLCQKVYEDSIEKLKKVDLTEKKVVILSDPSWDAGLLGIVAARVAEEFNKPTILFSEVEGRLKGSARSIDGIDIHKAIDDLTVELEAFGGHIMAAGLTLKQEYFNEFKQELEMVVDKLFDASYFSPVKYYDLDLKLADATVEFAKELNYLAPFGHANALPTFKLSFQNAKIMPMKNFHEHLTLHFHKLFSMIHFNGADYLTNYEYFKYKNILLEMQLNTFKGKNSVRAIVKGVSFDGLKTKEVSNFVKGNQLHQLSYSKLENAAVYNKIEEKNLNNVVKNLLKQNEMGVLIVCSNVKSYEHNKELIKEYDLTTHLFEVKDKLGLNAVVLGLENMKNLNNFKHIIFTDPVLEEGYLGELNKHTPAKLYVVDIAYKKHMFHLSTSREVFGIYFNAISAAAKQKLEASNIYFYFEELQKQNKQVTNFNYTQFIACLNVFCELNLIEKVNKDGVFYLKINKHVQSSLDYSNYYKQLA